MGMLSNVPFMVEFDAATLARMGMLMEAAPIFARYYTAAMNASVNKVQTEAKRRAPVLTGTLRRGITGRVLSPWKGIAGVGRQVPYARRREFGFTGRIDSRGYFFPWDPGAHYLEHGLQASLPFISATYRQATFLSWQTIAL